MENPVLDMLSILCDLGYEDQTDEDAMNYDDGERHTVAEARQVFNGSCDEIIAGLQQEIELLQKMKVELAGQSVKAFIKKHLDS